jgi:hypothetical protein
VDGEWHRGQPTLEAIRYGLMPDIERQIISEYESELEQGNFRRDAVQQRDGWPATYDPKEPGRAPAAESSADAEATA